MSATKRKLQPKNQQPTLLMFNFSKPSSPEKKEGGKKSKKEETKDKVCEVVRDDFVFFYSKHSPFSQFHACKFTVDGTEYNCMEQYMHHQKAVTFEDEVRAKYIMDSTDPLDIKKLGRQVQNFDKGVWARKSVKVVKKGNIEKFTQNSGLKAKLFDTYPKTLVEASPRDRLWGIGMGANNPNATNPDKWRGKNLLGKALTDVREELMKREKDENLLGTSSEKK